MSANYKVPCLTVPKGHLLYGLDGRLVDSNNLTILFSYYDDDLGIGFHSNNDIDEQKLKPLFAWHFEGVEHLERLTKGLEIILEQVKRLDEKKEEEG